MIPRRTLQLAADAAHRRPSPRAGMTLIEVMLGMVIIGTTALATLSALLFTWRVADSNLRALNAMEAGRSIAEQVMTLDFTTLGGSTLPVDLPSLPNGSLVVGSWNNRTDDIHNTPANPHDDFAISIKPEVAVSDDSSGVRCAQIVIHYSWEERSFFARRTREDSVTIVRSPIAAF